MTTVRQAEPRDAESAVDVVRRSITELCVADHRNDTETLATWLANKTPSNFLLWLANEDNFCVLAESGDQIVGVGLLHRSGEIRLFYLSPHVQRQGIGKAIHVALEAHASVWALSSLSLDSTALACPFYEALGYQSLGPPKLRTGVLQCYPYRKKLGAVSSA